MIEETRPTNPSEPGFDDQLGAEPDDDVSRSGGSGTNEEWRRDAGHDEDGTATDIPTGEA